MLYIAAKLCIYVYLCIEAPLVSDPVVLLSAACWFGSPNSCGFASYGYWAAPQAAAAGPGNAVGPGTVLGLGGDAGGCSCLPRAQPHHFPRDQ